LKGFILCFKKIVSLSSAIVLTNGMQMEAKAEVKTNQRCQECIVEQEKQKGIEPGLLQAIAHVESRMSRYVVNACGRGHSFTCAADAAKFVQDKQKEGYRNISVGLMQLHVPSHRSKFKSIEEMMDPDKNIAYAANLLKNLKKQTGSWERAVLRYNNNSTPYKNRVFGAWAKIRLKNGHSQGKHICSAHKVSDKISDKGSTSNYQTLLSAPKAALRLALINSTVAPQPEKVAQKTIAKGKGKKNMKKTLPCAQENYLMCMNAANPCLDAYHSSTWETQCNLQKLIDG
jgi:hypothetical protein